MKKLVLFLASRILAGTVHAFEVTKAEAATKIKTLPATITASGNYYLGPNINAVVPTGLTTPAITITARIVKEINNENVLSYICLIILPCSSNSPIAQNLFTPVLASRNLRWQKR